MTRIVKVAFVGSWVLTVHLIAGPLCAQEDRTWRTIAIETSEVTTPDLAISPDGRWLVLSMLGHLFRLPVEGGQAEQLTFGPSYNARPAVSPDGMRIAFQSDRDDSDGNIFVLDLATGGVTQVTRTGWADAPSWSPDGRSIAYLERQWQGWDTPATVWTITLDLHQPRRLSPDSGAVHSPFHLSDGRVGWAVIGANAATGEVETRLAVMAADGSVSTLLATPGIINSIVPTGDGFLARRTHAFAGQEYLARIDGRTAREEPVIALVDEGERAIRSLAVSPLDGSLFVGDLGRLWTVPPGDRRRVPVPFHATARLEVREPTPVPTWSSPPPSASRPPKGILFPRLSRDGESIVFLAARNLWLQRAGAVRRLTDFPVVHPAISPDGRRVAFGEVRSENAYYCVRPGGRLSVIDLATGETTELASGNVGPDYAPTWTTDGRRVVVWRSAGPRPCERFDLVAIGLDGTVDTLVAGATSVGMQTSASPDGRWIYYVGRPEAQDSWAEGPGTVFRVSLAGALSFPEPVAKLPFPLRPDLEGMQFGRVSPDGRWYAFRPPGRREVRVARLDGGNVAIDDSRVLTPVGGASGFDFDAAGSALIYSTPEGVWRHPLAGGDPEKLAVALRLQRPEAPDPVLLRRVRVLSFESGGFTPETSLLIEGGRIVSIGAVAERSAPDRAQVLDAGGRYAIPGLFDVHAHSGVAIGDPGRSALSYGITTIRSPGGLVHHNAQLADQEFAGGPSARWLYAGDIINGQGGSGTQIGSVDEAWNEVRLLKAWGASFVKSYTDLPWPLHRAVGDAARSLGLPVLRHGNNSREQVVKGVQAGGMLTHTAVGNEDLLRMMAAADIRTDPTLSGVWGHTVRSLLYPERFPTGAPVRPFGRFVDTDHALGIWSRRLQAVRRADRLGVTVLAGTDVYPIGSTLHFELELLADAGLAPAAVLRAATIEAAESVGAGADLGAVEVGRIADIVLLDADPLEDVANTQRIWRVIKDGVAYRPGDLRASRE